MKKFIAFALVALMFIGCTFAASNASNANGTGVLDIVTEVLESIPAFQLKAETVSAGTINTAISNVAAADPTHGKVTFTTDTLTSADGTVTFAINQIDTARLKASYTLTVAATDLELKRYADGTTPTAINAAEKFVVANAAPAVTVSSASIKGAVLTTVEMASVSAAGNVLTVNYRGVVAATSSAPKTLGTFSCTWGQNADAVPGEYEATVTLTVAAQ